MGMIDLEDWGRPENLGLRLEEDGSLAVAKRGGVAALLLGAGVWTAGSLAWSGELAFLESLGSLQGRIGSALLLASGLLALVAARLHFGDEF
jgi:hypothetical protein